MSSIRDLFFSYVISLFLLMIFVFDLTEINILERKMSYDFQPIII